MSDPIADRVAELDNLLAGCDAALAALDVEIAMRKQPILDQQAGHQAERDALTNAQAAVATVAAAPAQRVTP